MAFTDFQHLKYPTCDVLAYDDHECIAYFRMDDEVYEVRYDFLEQIPATEHQLRRIISAAGRLVWTKAYGNVG